MIQNPSQLELQKASNQGRRCTWEKLSAIKANCGIEQALDECVGILNHMRRLKRSAERAAAASQGYPTTVKFSASRRIPSWNCIARENSTGSFEEDFSNDLAASLHQGVSISAASSPGSRSLRIHRSAHDGSDSETEGVDINSWTRSGGPLMRTTSANKFIDFVQHLDLETEVTKGFLTHPGSPAYQTGGRERDPFSPSPRAASERSSENEFDQREPSNRSPSNSSIVVTEGDLLQPERLLNGIVFNIVKKEELALASSKSQGSECNNSEVAEEQIDSLGKEMDESSESDQGDDICSFSNSQSHSDPPVSNSYSDQGVADS